LSVSEHAGRFALERAVADYIASEAAWKDVENSDASPDWRPTAYSAKQSINPNYVPRFSEKDPLVDDLEDCVRIAAFWGYVACLRIGLDAGFDYGAHYLVRNAITGGRLSVLELLLDGNYADINEKMEHTSALGFAVVEQKVAIVDLLLTRGADPNIRVYAFVTKFQHSLSLVSYAGFKNNTELMKVLLSHGLNLEDPEYNHRPIWWAICYNNIDMLRLFIEKGVDLGPTIGIDWPLLDAVKFGHAEMVVMLLEKGGILGDASDIAELYHAIEKCRSVEVQQIFEKREELRLVSPGRPSRLEDLIG
jgi:hypothetical protein